MAEKLYLQDLYVGQSVKSRVLTIEAEEIVAFARAYDPQYFHTDPEAARKSLFGGHVASGWHTAALTMRLLVESVPIAGGLIGVKVELAWPRPVRPGDELRLESVIESVSPPRAGSDRGAATCRCTTLNQRDEPVQIMTAKLAVRARPADEGGGPP